KFTLWHRPENIYRWRVRANRTEVGTAGQCQRCPRSQAQESTDLPLSDDLVQPRGSAAEKFVTRSKRQLIRAVAGQHMRAIETGHGAVEIAIAWISRGRRRPQ